MSPDLCIHNEAVICLSQMCIFNIDPWILSNCLARLASSARSARRLASYQPRGAAEAPCGRKIHCTKDQSGSSRLPLRMAAQGRADERDLPHPRRARPEGPNEDGVRPTGLCNKMPYIL